MMLQEIELKDGKTFCEKCGDVVAVKEKPGTVNTAQKPYVLVDDKGHVIAELSTKAECWEKAV